MSSRGPRPVTLEVRLGSTPVAHLVRLPDERVVISFLDSYREQPDRPTLGLAFGDEPGVPRPTRVRLPPFFSNLLPEGVLRSLVAKRAGVHRDREFFLLSWLGSDLPGAVVVAPLDGERPTGLTAAPTESVARDPETPLRFSLAGIQLKFSMLRRGRGLTLPASGRGGDWIVKLPDNRYPEVPANEYAMMIWARAAGLDVPDVKLVPVADLDGLPGGLGLREDLAFAVRRFDRDGSTRIHAEDFAQVLGLYPEQKYDAHNYETIGRILWVKAGRESFARYLARLVFVVASGNADAHHKNWSLVYADGRLPTLSPAYDFVSTIQYLPDDRLALNLARSKRFEDVAMASFTRLARKVGAPEGFVERTVRAAVERTLDAWGAIRADLLVSPTFAQRLEAHQRRVPLLGRG